MGSAPSLFLSKKWSELEEKVFNIKADWVRSGGNIAKIVKTKSKLPFVNKYWMGTFWSTATGIGIYCKNDCDDFYNKIRDKYLFGIFQGMSNLPIKNRTTPFISSIVTFSDGKEALLRSFGRKRRNSIRQGLKRKVDVKIVDDAGEGAEIVEKIKSNYDYWKRDTEDLKRVFEVGFKKNLMKLFVSYVDETPVAEALFFLWNGRMTYSISGFLRKYSWHRPMDVLFWESMCWGIDNGFHELDLIGGSSGVGGIGKFKNEFGGVPETRHFLRDIKLGPLNL